MKPEIYISDCSDNELLDALKTEGIEFDLKKEYYYATGADHPGVWIVLTFIGTSILGGYIHDGFKKLIGILGRAARRQFSELHDDDGPMHYGIVLKSANLEIEYLITEEVTTERIQEVIAKVEACCTILDYSNTACHAQIPVQENCELYSYERQRGCDGDKLWLLNFHDTETLVFVEPECRFIRNVQI